MRTPGRRRRRGAPGARRRSRPVLVSQSFTVASRLPVARIPPPRRERQARHHVGVARQASRARGPRSCPTASPRRPRRRSRAWLRRARTARARTVPLCPSRRARGERLRRSQSRTSWSAPPEASRLCSPSGAKATARTEAEWPGQRGRLTAGGDVPDPDGLVVTRRGERSCRRARMPRRRPSWCAP